MALAKMAASDMNPLESNGQISHHFSFIFPKDMAAFLFVCHISLYGSPVTTTQTQNKLYNMWISFPAVKCMCNTVQLM